MARFARRRTLRLECLETREVMNTGGLSNDLMAMLAQINQDRQNPAAAAERALADPVVQANMNYYLGQGDSGMTPSQVRQDYSKIAPAPPLALNAALISTAQEQSQRQADLGQQTHDRPVPIGTELNNLGYSGATSVGENAYAYAQSVDHAMKAYVIDWNVSDRGHRRNLFDPTFREVGLGQVDTTSKGVGPHIFTSDFSNRPGTNPYLLGFAYSQDADGFYKEGEGKGGITIDVRNLASGQTSEVQTDGSGYYQLQLAPGNYSLTAHDGDRTRTQNVALGQDNVEVDFHLNDQWETPPPPTNQVVTVPSPNAPIALNSAASSPAVPSGGSNAVFTDIALETTDIFNFSGTKFGGAGISISSSHVYHN